MNILYVEDNKVNRIITQKILGKQYNIDVVETADEFFSLAKQKTYQVFLIDLNLNDPTIDGFGVLSHLKIDNDLSNAVFIAHTNYVGEDWEKRCLDAGFDYYIPKPMDIKVFSSLLDQRK